MRPHKQCDPSHCRKVDVQLGVVSQNGSTKQCDPSHYREVDVQHGVVSQHESTQAV